MKSIPLTQGKFALVDDEAYEWLSCDKWYASASGKTERWYAKRSEFKNGVLVMRVWMHKEILGVGQGVQVDHVNRDSLDNRRTNLRLATHADNQRNQGMRRTNKSGLKGVWSLRRAGAARWGACIRLNGKTLMLGSFPSPEAAHAAYCAAAIKLHGDFAPDFVRAKA